LPDLVLYDGACGLCSRLNLFVLERDRQERFRFAPLQGPLAGDVLRRHGREAMGLDTVYVVAGYGGPGERLLSRSRAALFVLASLPGYRSLARLLGLLPARWLDAAYDFVAARRVRWFGSAESCPLPRSEHRSRFLDGDR